MKFANIDLRRLCVTANVSTITFFIQQGTVMTKIFHRACTALVAGVTMAVFATAASAAIVGSTEVPLDARNSSVRFVEANVGNLAADALRWQASELGLNPTIGVINGGGIRGNSLYFPLATPLSPANVTDADVFNLLPFNNKVGVIGGVTVPDLLRALENSVTYAAPGDLGSATGRFLQVSGLFFSWDTTAPAGSRIIDVLLQDLTPLVDDGMTVSSLLLNIATIDFLAFGGDGYTMFSPYTFSDSGVLYRDALTNYITTPLGGEILKTDYPQGGEGRIQQNIQLIPEPGTLALLGLSVAGLSAARRHKQWAKFPNLM